MAEIIRLLNTPMNELTLLDMVGVMILVLTITVFATLVLNALESLIKLIWGGRR